jgi:DNA-directed RNA polymerase subunit RPC12/RpoP
MAFDDIITELHACEVCGHRGTDVEYTTDPLTDAQWNKEEWVYMCLKCLKHLREGIYEAITKSM